MGDLAGGGSVAVSEKWHWQLTLDLWHLPGDTWQLTWDNWNVTHDMWHMTYDMWHYGDDNGGDGECYGWNYQITIKIYVFPFNVPLSKQQPY